MGYKTNNKHIGLLHTKDRPFDKGVYKISAEYSDIREELVGIHAINPFIRECSASRAHMFSTHLSQALVFQGAEPSIITTGLEYQLGNNGFGVKPPDNCRVLSVIDRYSEQLPEELTPERIVLVMLDSGTLDYLSIPRYHRLSSHHAFIYDRPQTTNTLKVNQRLKKDEILAISPNIKHDGHDCQSYAYGINANLCLATLLETAEDGIVISKSLANKLKYHIVETLSIEFGSENIPLNMYGDINNVKLFPEIGETIREDAIVMATRPHNEFYCSLEDMTKVNYAFDTVRYAKYPGGKVLDVRAWSNRNIVDNHNQMTGNVDNYVFMLKHFYGNILSAYHDALNRYNIKPNEAKTTRRLRNLLIKANGLHHPNNKVTIKYKNQQVDMYRIEIDILHEVNINYGHKLTDKSGSKGVIVDIREDDKMPYIITNKGNRITADIVMDPAAVVSRMNISRLYEQYFNGASRKCQELMRLCKTPEEQFEILLEFLGYINLSQMRWYESVSVEKRNEILNECLNKEVYVMYRLSSEDRPYEIVSILEQSKFKPDRVPLNIPTYNGTITTDNLFTIAPVYTLLLSKTPDSFLSVASARVNHFGFPIGVSSTIRDGIPYRNSPTKVLSETEVRLYRAYVSDKAIVELKDRANNPDTHEQIYYNILDAKMPTNIEHVIDRSNGYNESVAMKLTNSIFNTFGIGIHRSNF